MRYKDVTCSAMIPMKLKLIYLVNGEIIFNFGRGKMDFISNNS